MKQLTELFWLFFKLGAFTFGGGYSMVPIIQHEICQKKKMLTSDEMDSIIIVAQSLPGVLAVNMATLVGYKLLRKTGAVICALGVVLPSFLVIILLANFIIQNGDNPYVKNAFNGIRAAVVGLILAAAVKLGKPCFKNKQQLVLLSVALIVVFIFDFHPVLLVVLGALAGWYLTRLKKEQGEG